jgi:tRNA(Ile)-lysidine synthase
MIPSSIIARVQAAIREQKLFQPGQHVLVAVSGGADSIALLTLLHALAPKWKLKLTVAHLHHGIRGREADADARFVRAYARRLGVGYIEGRVDVPRLAHRKKISLEMAGREARYAFFAAAARRRHCAAVATAHTADDQVETILLKLARGAGAQGLAGIPFAARRGNLKIIRPLRDNDRNALRQFLRRRRLTWREDATNADRSYLRNRVRHEVLPLLESTLNPQIRLALRRAAEILDKENDWLDTLTRDLLADCARDMPAGALNARRLAAQPQAARRRVLRAWLAEHGADSALLDFDVIDRLDKLVMERRGQDAVSLPGKYLVRKQRQCLHLSRAPLAAPAAFRVSLKIPGITRLTSAGLRVVARVAPGICREKPAGIGHYPARASLSLAAWRRRRIVVRSWRPGDRMAPWGLAGSKKVQDIFTDGKVPRDRRGRVPLFACGKEIVWIPGYRIARGWEVPNAKDKALQFFVAETTKCAKQAKKDGQSKAPQPSVNAALKCLFFSRSERSFFFPPSLIQPDHFLTSSA